MLQKSKLIGLIFAICLIVMFISLFTYNESSQINNVNETISESELYSDKEIKDAMDIVKKKFKSEFKGCILTDLWYDENISYSSADEWAKQYNSEVAIVLLSNFDVDSSGGDRSLNSNTTYTEWQWILVRYKSNTNWELKTYGY